MMQRADSRLRNAPVGRKSGLGRELGPDALNAFTEEKNVFINTEI